MLGKNNFNEKYRKMKMQSRKDHFSIRKLTIGAASVLLGFSFFNISSQTTKAATFGSGQQETVVNKQINATGVNHSPKLSTFSGLSSFLRSGIEENGSSESPVTSSASGNNSSTSATSSDSHINESNQGSNPSSTVSQVGNSGSDTAQSSDTSQSSQMDNSGLEANHTLNDSMNTPRIKTTHANDIVIHHYLVDVNGNKTTKPVKGLGDINGDTYIDGYVGDTKIISATDPEQIAPDGYEIVADQRSVTWTFASDKNLELAFYYKKIPTIQGNVAPSFAQQFHNTTASYNSPRDEGFYGDINVGGGLKLRYFFGTDINSSLNGSSESSSKTTLPATLPNYNLVDSTGVQINGGYAYYAQGYNNANMAMGINGDMNTLRDPIAIRLWQISSTGSAQNSLGAVLTSKWSADYYFNGRTYTIDFTGTMQPNGSLINYHLTARNVTGLDSDNNINNDLSNAFFAWRIDTMFLMNDKIPFFYIGNNQGLYMRGKSGYNHHHYNLYFNFSGVDTPFGWKADTYSDTYDISGVRAVFGNDLSQAYGQKVPKGTVAPAAGSLAYGNAEDADIDDAGGSGSSTDSGLFTIWSAQNLAVGDTRNMRYQTSIIDENAVAPKLELKPNGEDYHGGPISIKGTVNEEDPSLANLTYTYNIDGKPETTRAWNGPTADDLKNKTADFTLNIPPMPQLVDGNDHAISVTVTDPNGAKATQTYALRAPMASITVHHYLKKRDGTVTTDPVKPDTYVNGKVGQSVTVDLAAPDQAAPVGYHLLAGQSNITQIMPISGTGEVTVYYEGDKTDNTNNIIIHHVVKGSNSLVPGMNDTYVNGYVGEDAIIKMNAQPTPPAGYSLSPNQEDKKLTFKATNTQEVYIYYDAITIKQGSSIKVHQVTIPGSAPIQVLQFSKDRWSEILNGDLSHVTSVNWSDPDRVNEPNGILANSGYSTADIKVYLDNNSSFILNNVPVQIIGATKTQNGQEFDSNLEPISKTQKFSDSKGYIDTQALTGVASVDYYTFSDDVDGNSDLNIDWNTTNGTGQKQGYVLVHYTDGTIQAVLVSIKIKSQADQSANQVSQKTDLDLHVNETNAGQDEVDALQKTHWKDYFNNTDKVSSIKWTDRPNVTNVTEEGSPDTSGSLEVTFNDGSHKIISGVRVNVLGAKADSNAVTNSNQPLNGDAASYIDGTSKNKINKFNPSYSYVDDDGKDMLTPPIFSASQSGTKQTAHIKITYHDNDGYVTGSENVDVPILVKTQNEQNKNKVVVHNDAEHPINTHVGADVKYGLQDSVSIPGLTEGTDYKLSWANEPDISATGLSDGAKTITAAVKITYSDNSTTTKEVSVHVVGGENAGEVDFNINAPMDEASAKVALTANSISAINEQYPSGVRYKWSSTADGTGANNATEAAGNTTAYVIVTYPDHRIQAIAVAVRVKSQAEPAPSVDVTPKGGVIKIKRGTRLTPVNAKAAISNPDEFSGARFSWVAPMPNTEARGTKMGKVKVDYNGKKYIVVVRIIVY